MKITLIIPPAPYLIDGKVFPPLGILYAAAFLEKHGHEVKVIDMLNEEEMYEFEEYIIGAVLDGPDYIGITATTPDFPMALKILKKIKETNPNQKVIIGGSHSLIAPEECKKFFDMTGKEFFNKLGIKEDVNIRSPARHLIDMDSYHYEIDGRKATNVIGQLGCSFNCAFCCGRDIEEFNKVRTRDIKDIMSELNCLNARYGYTAFMFYDDEINLNKQRLSELCSALRKKDYKWRAFIRSDLLTEEMTKEMAESGCYELLCGVESGSDRILKVINKRTTSKINTDARGLCKKYGIRFKALMMIGLPSETKEDVMLTKQWLFDNLPDTFDISIFAPYPGSLIYDHKERFDIEFNIDYTKDIVFFKGIPGEYKSHVKTSKLTYEEIAQLRDEIEEDCKK